MRLQSGERLRSDLTIWTGGGVAPALLHVAKLAPKPRQWAPVDATLRSRRYRNVFVIGDATGNAYGVSYDNSFALITDFTVGTDMLQLKGTSASDFTVNSTDPAQVLITSIDPSVGLVAKINVVFGTAEDILNNTSFLA